MSGTPQPSTLYRRTFDPGFHNTKQRDFGARRALQESIIQRPYFKGEKTKSLEGAVGQWAHTAAPPPKAMDPEGSLIPC